MRTQFRSLLLVAILALLAACESTPLKDNTTPTKDVSSGQTNRNANPNAIAEVQAGTQDSLNSGALAKKSVYFDYDSFIVKDEYRAAIEAHAKFLLANHGRKIMIQGNADERGGSEYNLALGQKRAEAVRRALSLLGVPEGQVEAVSYGKEKPKALGHDEAAWAENRRADIVYQ